MVRRAALADAPVVVEFNRRLALETENKVLNPDWLKAGVVAGLTDANKGLYFVAEKEATIWGMMMVTFEWSDWRNGWFWWIQSVYVRAEARRTGVFRSLFDHVYRTARETPQVIGLRLYVEQQNHTAQQTYARLGMKEAGYRVLEKYPL
jgi:ribosomal protein S18 acetylase RimI-like enzyme